MSDEKVWGSQDDLASALLEWVDSEETADGRNLLEHAAAELRRITELRAEVERLRGIVEVATDRDRALCAEKDDLAAEVERLRGNILALGKDKGWYREHLARARSERDKALVEVERLRAELHECAGKLAIERSDNAEHVESGSITRAELVRMARKLEPVLRGGGLFEQTWDYALGVFGLTRDDFEKEEA